MKKVSFIYDTASSSLEVQKDHCFSFYFKRKTTKLEDFKLSPADRWSFILFLLENSTSISDRKNNKIKVFALDMI